MSTRRVVAVVCVAVAAAVPAAADDLPKWSAAEICAADSAPGQCRLFEQRARAQVAEAWITLPDNIKRGCLAEFIPPLQPSWRIMSDCIGELSVVTRINIKKSAIERDRRVAEVLKERRVRAEREAKRLAELKRKEAERKVREAREAAERKVREAREAAERAKEAKRVAAEEATFRKQLAEQRQRDREQAAREKAAREAAAAAAREREEQRLAGEEASFLKQLAANRKREREEAERKKAAEAAQKQIAIKPEPQVILKVEKPAKPAARAKPVPQPTIASLQSRKPEIVRCETRLEETAKAGSIRFAFDSADILKDAEITLDALAAAVRACGRLRVVIEGHTDTTGRINYNQSLSERRAENVANYLISAGVKSKHVRFIGYGELRPVASNAKRSGRAMNRRIEYRVR